MGRIRSLYDVNNHMKDTGSREVYHGVNIVRLSIVKTVKFFVKQNQEYIEQ